MAQVSWRADDELVERVRQVASRSGRSLNEYLTVVLSAATDPELAGSEADGVRERLALAGLLEEPTPGSVRAPGAQAVADAAARAASGTPLDELIASGR